MFDIKAKAQDLDSNVQARNMQDLIGGTKNIYYTLNVINARARQLNDEIKSELYKKLEEFATVSETIEEVMENKEQIEISKFYEKLPNPCVIATNEFIHHELAYRHREDIIDSETEEQF